MLQRGLFALLLSAFLLAGCCSSGGTYSRRDRACESRRDASRAAAKRGWENVKEGFSPQPHPVLHVGMEARAAADALGSPPRTAAGEAGTERWIYPERGLTVFVEDGAVAGWERGDAEHGDTGASPGAAADTAST